jgi:NADPH:quinone reductase-like Zn-dependent oxidoreductase
MRVWRIASFGIENLQQVEAPIPVIGADQVLIRLHAVSLNFRDLLMVKGHYNPKLALPRIPCSDGAGKVAAVGTNVHQWKVGDRVAGIFMQNWLDGKPSSEKHVGALGGDIDGMLAEYVALPAESVVAVPDHLTYEEASTLPCAGVTAWNAVVTAARVHAGQTVLIQGTGGVSIFALQFAKLAGARVIGTSSSDEKLARARSLGLDAGLNYKTSPDWAPWVVEQSSGEGADLVVEVGGAGTLPQSLKAVRVGGMVAQIGVLTGVEEKLLIAPILHKQINLQGIYVGSRQNFLDMNTAIHQTGLRPVVDKIFAFSDIQEALSMMEAGNHFGKIVVRTVESARV